MSAHGAPGDAALPRSTDPGTAIGTAIDTAIDTAAGAFAGLLDSDASPDEVEEVVSFVAAVPLGVRRPAPRWVAPVFALGAIAIVPWVVYLGYELPERSTAQHYNLAWVGFDLFLVLAMARTAIFAWKGRRQVQLPAVATATLLIVDAWFDIMTASAGWPLTEALILAFCAELPIAAMAVYIARNVDKVIERAEHRLAKQAQQLLVSHLMPSPSPSEPPVTPVGPPTLMTPIAPVTPPPA